MNPADDALITEQVQGQVQVPEQTEALGKTPAPSSLSEPTSTPPTPIPLESGMETGQGADDEPEIAIGDRHTTDALRISPEEAKRMLGGKDG